MEEDVGVPVKVTRLRRRLSVELSEDVGSPLTPSKKRGGRLAAKPQLELIDENAQVSSPKRPRKKSIAKDVTDAEEKPVTPSRRSTRIKSNTSIISETLSVVATDSPRAKRAFRRNSAAGSDNEGPITPARQTRRTRKDSASSVENQEPAAPNRPLQVVKMVIAEETENEIQKSEKENVVKQSKLSPSNAIEELSPNSARKSKRLLEKRNRRSGSYISDLDSSVTALENKSLNISVKNQVSMSKSEKKLNKSAESNEINENLSDSNLSLLKTLNTVSKVRKSNNNKSMSALDEEENGHKKRNRTESWPALSTVSPAKDNIVFSDNEQAKKKRKKSANIQSFLNKSGSGINSTGKEDKTYTAQNEKDNSQISLNSPSNRKKRQSETSFVTDTEQPSEDEKPTVKLRHKENTPSNQENTIKNPENNDNADDMAILFQNLPSNVQAIVYFEDSDSNNTNTETAKNIEKIDSEDQCVPVVQHDIEYQDKIPPNLSKSISNNKEIVFSSQSIIDKQPGYDISNSNKTNDDVDNSCEPMDIDETIHEEILQKSQNMIQEFTSERKSLTLPQGNSIIEDTNKSKRKSSISARATPDRSRNENKSTLILSQIKDLSAESESTQSPKPVITESSNSNNDNDNKTSKTNLSSNDLKETPLRPKNVTNLTMQTSTPITTPKIEESIKVDPKNPSTEKKSLDLSKSIDESRSSDEDSVEPSQNNSKFLDDEAEEASNDYESGDSRDEEERQYEEQNEIVEQGETLGSEDDASNDSDYEKDSFIVSSDAEDDDLLSGSGDDLSYSDNELSMSKKSKKKYNERKLKEQKAASREMFESRHKLDSSEQKSPAPKTNKNNRMRIDSSLLDSDEEVVVKPKKNNRLRLDSTLDISAKIEDTSESLNKSNRKNNKSLQESIFDQSADIEKEITICNESITNTDPLQVSLKQEPKTPQKDLNISVVQFTDRQDIENIEVTNSNSILNQTDTDPLQATIVNGDSDSSESEEIMQNYDSILNDLNKNKNAKLNYNNVSLNMDKKSKKKNAAIIDQLNLTNIKNKKARSIDVVDSKTEPPKKTDNSDIESSDSIDLKLLFSEDNCGSSDDNTNSKNQQHNKKDEKKMFVPLKKSIGKTNIFESIDANISQQNLSLTESGKKKKNRKTSIMLNESVAEPEDPNQAKEDVTVLNESSSKKKKQRASLSATELEEEYRDPKQAKEDVAVLNKSSSKKKKQRNSLSSTELAEECRGVNESINALLNESSSKKKKNTNTSVVEEPRDILYNELVVSESMKKKKKRKNSSGTEGERHSEGNLFFIDTAGASVSETDDHAVLDKTPLEVLFVNEKKKNKKLDSSQNISETNDQIQEESHKILTPKSHKKKKKSRDFESSVICDDSDDAPEEVLYRSEKASNQGNDLQNTECLTESGETESGKKKKKKKLSAASNQSVENNTIAEDSSIQNSKKRKRMSSDTGVKECTTQATEEAAEPGKLDESLSVGSHKKKRKISHNNEVTKQTNAEADNVVEDEKKSKKKKHKKNHELNFENTASKPEINQIQVKKNKKRKEREEDNDSKKTKVSKENSFQEIHKIPHLPVSIISQLEDKPRDVKEKPKVISTSKFVVETARQKRAKPSNYLEESIYLNADSPLAKQEKSRIKKPKVLPFIPTASISESGYTTNFKINKVSQNVQFVAEPAGITFSKEKYLQKKEIKRLGTYDLYKKQINKKLSKF